MPKQSYKQILVSYLELLARYHCGEFMLMTNLINRRWVLASRPQGLPSEETFRLETAAVQEPAEGEVLVRNVYLGVDPGMRMMLSGRQTGVGAFEPWPLGTVAGYATVGVVEASRHAGFASGDWVTGILQWQDYATVPGAALHKVLERRVPLSTAINVLGIPGLSAYFGLLRLGALRQGDTILVTSAAGAVGVTAGQIAKLKGCRVIGVAGGADKCAWLRDELGLDGAIDYRATPNIGAQLSHVAPDGIDVLFDNVGNAMVDAALPHMREHGRIVICGQIADYGKPVEEIPGLHYTNCMITHRLTMRGLFVHDFAAEFPGALAELGDWAARGLLRWRDDVEVGIDKLPGAFASLFTSSKFGRKLVCIAPELVPDVATASPA